MTLRITPEPLGDELLRPHLLDRLLARFTHSVTCVVGGAGFGKSTVVAQAVRHNEAHPIGFEVWISCRPGDEDAEQLGHRMLAQLATLGAPEGSGPVWRPSTSADHGTGNGGPASSLVVVLAGLVERAVVAASPIDVSIVLDDVHLVTPGSSGDRLLVEVMRRLPQNGHLVLVSRVVPSLPLARLRAADQVLDIGEVDLAFTDAEVAALARSLGRLGSHPASAPGDALDVDDPTGGSRSDRAPDVAELADLAELAELGGWPALVRLGLVAPRGAHRDFLVEEVLGSLDELQRATLFALTLLGPADDGAVSHVVGRPVATGAVLRGVPLVTRTSGTRHAAHQLWDSAVNASIIGDRRRAMYQRAIDLLVADGQPARAAQAALAIGDADALDRIALEVVRSQLNHIPLDTVRTWLAAAPADRGPALRVLEALVHYTVDARDDRATALLDEVMTLSRERADLSLESTALAASAVIAHARQDMGRLFPLALRAAELEPNGDPVLDLMRAAMPAIEADLRGDPEGVLDAVRDVQWSRLPTGAAQLMGRLYMQAAWMAGRAEETVAFADRWYRGADSYLGGLPHLARWLAGSPDAALRSGIGMNRSEPMNDRDRLVGSCFATMIAASSGRNDEVEELWGDGSLAGLAFDNARDHAHLTYTAAVRHVLAGDEDAAADRYQRHLERWGLDPLGERHLRRFPAPGHVLSPTLRTHWDHADLGPAHASARASARVLLQVRAGAIPGDIPPVPELVTHLPLPWSVEIVARLCALGDARALPMLQALAEVVGTVATDELQRRAKTGPSQLDGAGALAAQLPHVPLCTTSIRVLGPIEVSHGGSSHGGVELRRLRVRQLLVLLVLERHVTRDRVLELLWPDLAPDAASNNLRVTLSHLRKVLEPDRPPGSAGFHLRVDAGSIQLSASPHLRVDAWEAADLERSIERTSDLAAERDLLRSLVGLWRGAPFADLDDVVELGGAVEHVRRRHVECLLRLGELHIAAGVARSAKQAAQQALDVDPYCEQAHRLAIAADLRLDDAGAVRRSMARLSEAMAELGVEVGPATRMLLHRTSQRVRRSDPDGTDGADGADGFRLGAAP